MMINPMVATVIDNATKTLYAFDLDSEAVRFARTFAGSCDLAIVTDTGSTLKTYAARWAWGELLHEQTTKIKVRKA